MTGPSTLPAPVIDRLLRLYGTRAVGVEALASSEPRLARPIDEVPGLIAAEVVLALRAEQAGTLSAAAELGWTDTQVGDQITAYRRYSEKLRPPAGPAVA